MLESARLCNRCAKATQTELARFLHLRLRGVYPRRSGMNVMKRVIVFGAGRDPNGTRDAIQDETRGRRRADD